MRRFWLFWLLRRRLSSAAARMPTTRSRRRISRIRPSRSKGELVQFLFRNPHSFVHVMVKEKDGTMVRYAVEWGGAGQLGGQGVTRETLKPGDHVIISGSPGRNPADHRVRMVTLQRPKDGFGWGKKPGEVVE